MDQSVHFLLGVWDHVETRFFGSCWDFVSNPIHSGGHEKWSENEGPNYEVAPFFFTRGSGIARSESFEVTDRIGSFVLGFCKQNAE